MMTSVKRRVFQILEAHFPDDRWSKAFDWFLIVLIVANVAGAVIETVESIHAQFAPELWAFEVFSVTLFTIEYLGRIWTATEHIRYRNRSPLMARLHFAFSGYALVDLIAIAPFFVGLFVPFVDLRILRTVRLLRLLKLVRYSPALATLARVVIEERRALGASLLIMAMLILTSATLMYWVEREAQPDMFGSIPAAMWWAVATLTTIGYGDVVPVTNLGRTIGGIIMIGGFLMFALPVGIIASGFQTELRRRESLATWGMVARVPLFARLDVLSVARLVNLLHVRVAAADSVIYRPGDPADALYFIADGEVKITHPDRSEPAILTEGQFFGEIALLQKTTRASTARAATRTRLLVLDLADFDRLMQDDADLRAEITATAEQRMTE
ncbi:MAG: cyclic nucleotide-gated ion channel [Alphaproteobacteria bacterium]